MPRGVRPNFTAFFSESPRPWGGLTKTVPPAQCGADGSQPHHLRLIVAKALEQMGKLSSQVCSLPPAFCGLPGDVQEVRPPTRARASHPGRVQKHADRNADPA